MNLNKLSNLEKERYDQEHWEGSFEQYSNKLKKNPGICRNAFARLHDAILYHGSKEYVHLKEKIVHYNFFDDPFDNGLDAIEGLDESLMTLVRLLESAAKGYGPDKRIILLHGPVGSSKSTIARLLKKGLEFYTKLPEGEIYTHEWHINDEVIECPMHEEPFKIIPIKYRKELGISNVEGNLCPLCRLHYKDLMNKYDGDLNKVLEHVKVKRFTFSEDDRLGVTTFQPKDEKNQDSTELTGDIDYRKIAEYGKDSDPRAFNFDGELNCANRGLIEMIEILKLDTAFLYDLLTASQEHKIKPKKFAHVDIDEVIIGHTNEPEFLKLQKDPMQEALRDRIVRVNIPYVLSLDEEIKIYEKSFSKDKVDKDIAPHTIEIAAIWAILTRLEAPDGGQLTLMQKMKLYNGKRLPGFNDDNIRELKEKAEREGMEGISPRYVQDRLSSAIVNTEKSNVNPFMILNELDDGLDSYSLVSSKDVIKGYRDLLEEVKTEYEDIIKNEVQRAIAADDSTLARLCGNYIDNVKAYTSAEKVRNPITGKDDPPDERLMRSIEEKIDIPEDRKDDFRQQMMNYIGGLAVEGKTFDFKSNDRLLKALELKLFDDQKDTIKLHTISHGVMDDDTQEKIEVVKSRLMNDFGYDEQSAQDILEYVASIYARSDAKDEN